MTFIEFDAAYVKNLSEGDTETEAHFTKYFGELLFLKLRHRIRNVQLIEDIRQETLMRVLKVVRNKGIEHPERLGGFVNTVSNNVMFEELRKEGRTLPMSDDAPEPRDERVDMDGPLLNEELKAQVASILETLPEKDCRLLRMIFLEEVPKEQVCRLFNVDGDYLRVLVHRAKSRFRAEFVKRAPAAMVIQRKVGVSGA